MQVPGKVVGEGYWALRLFPGYETASGPGCLWRSASGPRSRISLGDKNFLVGAGKGLVSGGRRELSEVRRHRGKGMERHCFREVLARVCQSELSCTPFFWL